MYKLVRQDRGVYKTLFHGVNGSRELPVGQWLEARMTKVRDGSGNKYYESGWHCLRTREEAERYLRRFKKKEGIVIVEVEARETWRKEHSPFDVVLARYVRILDDGSRRNSEVGQGAAC